MPRRPRGATGSFVYHVLNRGVRRAVLFDTPADYSAFEQVMVQALQRVSIRLLAYCAMPNHWHLILWPTCDGELSRFMHWLTMTHAQRWHACRRTSGTGAVYQGRFKAFPIESDIHMLRVCRYVERNSLRAGLVEQAQDWRWSSLWRRCNHCDNGLLDGWPISIPDNWVEHVNEPQSEAELESLRHAVIRSTPFGSREWTSQAARILKMEAQTRPLGRPRTAG
jgi:putative transposase